MDKKWPRLLSTLLWAFFLFACTQPQPAVQTPVPPKAKLPETGQSPLPLEAAQPVTGDSLVILSWQKPDNLNPHLAQTAHNRLAARIVYEPLASFNSAGELVPFLAAEIPTRENGGLALDGKAVTWRLKQDVFWSDGHRFTADDVKFTYEFIVNPDIDTSTSHIYDLIDYIEVVDAATLTIYYEEVNAAWALPFVGETGMILPRHIFEAYNGANAFEAPGNWAPVGTGPYMISAFETTEAILVGADIVETNRAVFVANPYYREADRPFFSKVELLGGGLVQEAARLVFETGEVDVVTNLQIDGDLLEQYAAGSTIAQVWPNPGGRVERLLFNQTDPNRQTVDGERSSLAFPHPFLSDHRVREALTLAIDREAIAAYYGPTGSPVANTLVAPTNFASTNTTYTYDLNAARRLLDEAGWVDSDGDGIRDKDGVKMRIVFQANVSLLRQAIQETVAAAWREIGVEVQIEVLSSDAYLSGGPDNTQNIPHFYADVQLFTAGNRNPDPSAYMGWFTCAQIPQMANNWQGRNVERWCNEAYDDLFSLSKTELDPRRREQLFIQLNDLLIHEYVHVPLVHRAEIHALNNSLQGVEFTPWDSVTWLIAQWRR